MPKTILMLIAFAAVFAVGAACFGPSSKKDPNAPSAPSSSATNAPAR